MPVSEYSGQATRGVWRAAWWYRNRLTHIPQRSWGQGMLGAIPLFRWSLGRCGGGPGQDISIIIMQRGVHQETPLVVRALGSGRRRSRTNLYASVIVPELPCLCVCVRVQSGGAAVEQMARDIFANRPAA
jgi:hypothetical protein